MMMASTKHVVNRGLFSLCLSALLLLASPAYAVIEGTQFDSPQLEARYYDLIAELRCLVCQNQNLADSDAGLAKDLRRKTSEMLKAGKSDEEILSYMRERYGDFVLYKPPLNAATFALWVGPFLLLFGAICLILINIKRKQTQTESTAQTAAQAEKARELINSATELSNSNTTTEDKN